jgi:chromosome segregation ATPase
LGSLLLPLVNPKTSFIQQTKENIESVFTSMTYFVLFLVSIGLLIGTALIIIHNKREFSVQGVFNIKAKQKLLDQRRKAVSLRARALAPAIQTTTRMIGEMKERLKSTKEEMKKKFPVFEEKKSGLQIRQDEIMREKLAIDEKIRELQDIENKLLAKHKGYETEKQQINYQENTLKQHFEKTKSMIGNLTSKFKAELEQEHQLNLKRDKLNRTELSLLAKKQQLVESGKDAISNEKMNVLQEKVRLEHERNTVQEELFSLANRRKDIESAQESLQKQHADVVKEQNVFDANKKALASTLLSLQQQTESLNKILEDSKHSEIAQPDDNA